MDTIFPVGAALAASEARSLFRPLGQADGLPGRVYSGAEYWEIERQRLFRDDWFAIGCMTDVPSVGDVLPVSIAGWELVLVRSGERELKTFHNVCRHRGTKLVHKKQNVRNIACGWHCWTYGLDGRLLNTPIIGGPRVNQHEAFDRSKLGLVEIRTEVWNDTVFINISGTARPFDEFSLTMNKLFERYHLEDYDLDHAVGHADVELGINWKLYHEGGLEGYHIPFVHPALELPDRYIIDNDPDVFTSLTGALAKYKRLGPLVGLPDDTLAMNVLADAALKAGDRLPYTICFVTPTLIFAAWPEAIILTLLRPISPSRTAVRRNMYFIGEGGTSAKAAAARAKYVDIWLGVTLEDSDYSVGVQTLSGQRQELGLETRFSPYWEEAVQHFQQRIARRAYGAQPNS